MSTPDPAAILRQVEEPEASALALLAAHQTEPFNAVWRRDPRLYRGFARKLIAVGHYTRAFELAREGLGAHTGDHELEYLRALALARGGNTRKAADYVQRLLQAPDLDRDLQVEAGSLLGRLRKDRYTRTQEAGLRTRLAEESAGMYERAYQISGDVFPGINAATMFLLAGAELKARQLALAVAGQCRAALQRRGGRDDYWLFATLGEACVILGETNEAATWYGRAAEGAARRKGDVASMRRNLQLLRQTVPVDDQLLDLLDPGRVVAFAGHMIDSPARLREGKAPRFPADPELERRVRLAIEGEIDRLNASVGYCSAACGSDILFAECMLERGAEMHIVLPYDRGDFYLTSVDFGLEEMASWRERCDRVLEAATEVHYSTTEPFLGDEELLAFVNTFAQGLAVTRSSELGVEPWALVVLEPSAVPVVGGTAYFLERWLASGRQARQIDLAALRAAVGGQPCSPARASPLPPGTAGASGARRQVKVMLFADVKNFSQLSEQQAPAFFPRFLTMTAEVLQASENPPVFRNTWGDGLFLVFDRVVDCADFAMRLLERMSEVDWEALQLPGDTTVRMGIHAGPVYRHEDPIIGRRNFFGSHVNRAARIEPITTPGCAFASEQAAALLAAEPERRFICEYVAVEELAKGYDRCPLYRLERA